MDEPVLLLPFAARALDNDPLLTGVEVAALTRVSPKTVSGWAAAGRLQSVRTPGGHRRYRRSAVDAL